MKSLTEVPSADEVRAVRDKVAYRLGARVLDLHIGLWVMLAGLMWRVERWDLWLLAALAGAFAVDALIYAVLGTTPGRWWLGLRVVRRDGAPLSRAEYAVRNFKIWLKGTACCLVPLSALPFTAVYRQLLRGEAAFYDRRTGHRVVEERPISPVRRMTFTGTLAVISVVSPVVIARGCFELWRL